MKKYAICGISNRALNMFLGPMFQTFSAQAELVAALDSDPRRFEVLVEQYPQAQGIPTYGSADFDRLVRETQPDVVIVAGRDNTHVDYILQALAHDLDVISEKPMVTTAEDCRRVLEAEAKSKGTVTVTFNVRYGAMRRRMKEMILEDKVGFITSVELNWYIDTHHGSSYFQRWNRIREFSGGLSIHKSTHHLDMVHWLIDQQPVQAFSYGARNYYGAESPFNPSKKDGRHCSSCTERAQCAYYSRWHSRSHDLTPKDDHLGTIKNDASKGNYTGYQQDACMFDSEIDIEDTYSATVKYDKGAFLSYTANFSSPFEGLRLAINGTKGRIESVELSSRGSFAVPEHRIDYYPLFGAKESIYVLEEKGSHGGSDPLLQEDLFLGPDPKRGYAMAAGAVDGAYAVALGEAIWRSSQSNLPINIADLIGTPR